MPKRLIATIAVLTITVALFTTLSSHAQTSNSRQGSTNMSSDTVSYALGYNIGASLKTQGIHVDVDLLHEGIQAGLGQKKARMSEDTMKQVLNAFQRQLAEKKLKERRAEGERQKRLGATFLQENKKKPGVKVTDTGLQYKVIEPGTGQSPKPDDYVVVHYTGELINGKQFDSSRARNSPAVFRVDRVIGGWTEALQLMKEGARYKLFIPPELAYGEHGSPDGNIPPNATLIFDVELIKIKKPDQSSGNSAQH